VVVYHHGFPSARCEAEVLVPAIDAYPSVRLLAFDRPGIGDSDPVEHVSFRGWANDLALCADALHLDRFALTGTSAGTPHALAAALAMPHRVTRVVMACPVAEHAPGHRNGDAAWLLRLARTCPRSAAAVMKAGAAMVRRNPDAIKRLVPLSPIEKEMLKDPAKRDLLVRTMLDASKQGTTALVQTAALLPGPWGLPLCRVAVPVTFFHGTADRLAPPWMSPHLARQIPGATVRIVLGEGHLSLPANHAAAILAAVVVG
jgi:pimeloyl-ACP methyl ester carboxylesterase